MLSREELHRQLENKGAATGPRPSPAGLRFMLVLPAGEHCEAAKPGNQPGPSPPAGGLQRSDPRSRRVSCNDSQTFVQIKHVGQNLSSLLDKAQASS